MKSRIGLNAAIGSEINGFTLVDALPFRVVRELAYHGLLAGKDARTVDYTQEVVRQILDGVEPGLAEDWVGPKTPVPPEAPAPPATNEALGDSKP